MVLLRGFMSRSIVLLSALFIGCSVGEVPLNGAGPDGGNNGTDGSSSALCVNRATTPVAAHVHGAGAGGGTKAGEGCIVAGCHLAGGDGPTFVIAGTLYKPDGVTPSAGATIHVTADAGGAKAIAVTDDAGNFSSTQAINPFPGVALASTCPTTDRSMAGKIAGPNDGNCNGGNACHQVPGGLPMVLADQ